MKIICKQIDNPKYSSHNTFKDFMFIMVCCIVLFFMIAIVNQNKNNEGIRHKAEFVITMEWDKEDQNDIDLWLKDPKGNIIYYKDKEAPSMFLDRDDLGHQNDAIEVGGVTKIIKINQEIISIRSFVPGRWIVAIHFYKRHDKKPPGTEIPVNIQMNKMNPQIKILFNETKIMRYTWQEETVATFDMLPDGTITNMELNGEMPIVHERLPTQVYGPDTDGDGDPEAIDMGAGNYPAMQSMRDSESHRNIDDYQNENLVPEPQQDYDGGL